MKYLIRLEHNISGDDTDHEAYLVEAPDHKEALFKLANDIADERREWVEEYGKDQFTGYFLSGEIPHSRGGGHTDVYVQMPLGKGDIQVLDYVLFRDEKEVR